MSALEPRTSAVMAAAVAVAVVAMGAAPAEAAGVGVSGAGDAIVRLSQSETAVFRLPLAQGLESAGNICGAIDYSLNGQREAFGLTRGSPRGSA